MNRLFLILGVIVVASTPAYAERLKVELKVTQGVTDCWKTWTVFVDDQGSKVGIRGGTTLRETYPVQDGAWSGTFRLPDPSGSSEFKARGNTKTKEISFENPYCHWEGKY